MLYLNFKFLSPITDAEKFKQKFLECQEEMKKLGSGSSASEEKGTSEVEKNLEKLSVKEGEKQEEKQEEKKE